MHANRFAEDLWLQFGAALDMLRNAIDACPDDVWADPSREPKFWYVAYHALFWLDLYLDGTREGFVPPEPFTLDELKPEGVLPETPYSKETLRAYWTHCFEKCRTTLRELTEAAAERECVFPRRTYRFSELLIYNFRHVQHHVGQLNLILRERSDIGAVWVGRTEVPLRPC